jgi:putative aldouronate transport system permease protein
MKTLTRSGPHEAAASVHSTAFWRKRWNVRGLYVLLLIPLVYVIIFNYTPIYGILMAFKRFQPQFGIWRSPWVGFYNREANRGGKEFKPRRKSAGR